MAHRFGDVRRAAVCAAGDPLDRVAVGTVSWANVPGRGSRPTGAVRVYGKRDLRLIRHNLACSLSLSRSSSPRSRPRCRLLPSHRAQQARCASLPRKTTPPSLSGRLTTRSARSWPAPMGSPPARPAPSDRRRRLCGSPAARSPKMVPANAVDRPHHLLSGGHYRAAQAAPHGSNPAHVSFFGPNGSTPMGQRWNFAWNATAPFLRRKGVRNALLHTLRSRTDARITGWYDGSDGRWSTDYKRHKLFDKKRDARPGCDELRRRCPRNAIRTFLEPGW